MHVRTEIARALKIKLALLSIFRLLTDLLPIISKGELILKKRNINNDEMSSLSSYKVELPISYCIYTKI